MTAVVFFFYTWPCASRLMEPLVKHMQPFPERKPATIAQKKSKKHLNLAVSGKSPSSTGTQIWAALKDCGLEQSLFLSSSLDVFSLIEMK